MLGLGDGSLEIARLTSTLLPFNLWSVLNNALSMASSESYVMNPKLM